MSFVYDAKRILIVHDIQLHTLTNGCIISNGVYIHCVPSKAIKEIASPPDF